MALIEQNNARKIWDFLKSKGFNDYACAGILANLDAESGLNPKNLQDSFQAMLGFTDDSYVAAIDSGAYTREQFATDGAGAFLCQWTWHTRKRALYDFCKSSGASIGDLNAQLNFFYMELSTSFTSVLKALQAAKSVQESTIAMMLKFECPYDQSATAQNKRITVAQKYYMMFAAENNANEVINMGYKYYKKGQAVKISDHFYSTEFDCHGSGCCTQTIVNDMLPVHLEQIRNHFKAPITITSPYRCPVHNSRPSVGGAPGSRHTKGDACDFVVKGVAPRIVAQYCESIGILGIGLYETQSDGFFVHIDERNYKSFWYGQNEEPRTTFGTYTGATSGSGSVSSATDTILNMGDSGPAVKSLQEKLIKLGYSCGQWGADGDFGNGTYQAVRKFQKDAGIGVDGIVGYGTATAIDAAIKKLNTQNSSGNFVNCEVVVTADLLNVRSGAGTKYGIVRQIKNGTRFTVVEESDGWCKIGSPSGWVSKDYIKRV